MVERAPCPCQGGQTLSTGSQEDGARALLCAIPAPEDAATCPIGQSAQAMYQLRPLIHELMSCMCVFGSELPPLLAQVLIPAEHRCNVCSKAGHPLEIGNCDGITLIGSH